MIKNSNLIDIEDSEIYYISNLFDQKQSQAYLNELLDNIEWKHESIKLFGKQILQPRLTAWYGDQGKVYTYSGLVNTPIPWTNPLLEIKDHIEKLYQVKFNSALLNLYRNGQDSMGWHADNEKELGSCPIISSVSFGASRLFKLKHKYKKNCRYTIQLDSGSCLLMMNKTQEFWLHQIPKQINCLEPRINITYRYIYV